MESLALTFTLTYAIIVYILANKKKCFEFSVILRNSIDCIVIMNLIGIIIVYKEQQKFEKLFTISSYSAIFFSNHLLRFETIRYKMVRCCQPSPTFWFSFGTYDKLWFLHFVFKCWFSKLTVNIFIEPITYVHYIECLVFAVIVVLWYEYIIYESFAVICVGIVIVNDLNSFFFFMCCHCSHNRNFVDEFWTSWSL